MSTTRIHPDDSKDFDPGVVSTVRHGRRKPRRRGQRPVYWVIAFALALLIVGVLAATDGTGDRASNAPLVLSVGEGGAAASCLPFDVEILATMSRAFAGTVTAVASDAITVRVDDWYIGGEASTVELRTLGDAKALIGGFPLEVGAPYLLSASDDALSYCGYSGPATPALRQAFDTAFGGR